MSRTNVIVCYAKHIKYYICLYFDNYKGTKFHRTVSLA